MWRTRFLTNGRYSNGNKLCSSTRWPIPSFFWADFITVLIQSKKCRLARSTDLCFRYLVDVLSFNNHSFGYFIHLINPKELEIKDKTDTVKSVSYFDLHLKINGKGKLLIERILVPFITLPLHRNLFRQMLGTTLWHQTVLISDLTNISENCIAKLSFIQRYITETENYRTLNVKLSFYAFDIDSRL